MPVGFGRFTTAEIAKWAEVARSANVRLEGVIREHLFPPSRRRSKLDPDREPKGCAESRPTSQEPVSGDGSQEEMQAMPGECQVSRLMPGRPLAGGDTGRRSQSGPSRHLKADRG